MQIQLRAPNIYLANHFIDFRKGITGITEIVVGEYGMKVNEGIYIFYNRHKNKLKLLSYHRNGSVLLHKQLHKKKFTVKDDGAEVMTITEEQMTCLLAGLDWLSMSEWEECDFTDYY